MSIKTLILGLFVCPYCKYVSAQSIGLHRTAVFCYDVGKTETNEQLEVAVKEANERLAALHHLERQSVRSALIEERGRLCLFVCGLKPVMVCCDLHI